VRYLSLILSLSLKHTQMRVVPDLQVALVTSYLAEAMAFVSVVDFHRQMQTFQQQGASVHLVVVQHMTDLHYHRKRQQGTEHTEVVVAVHSCTAIGEVVSWSAAALRRCLCSVPDREACH
jgi:hypothetical protein